jgi:formate-dependent nitrite reductase membrane component NrfD
MLVGKEPAFFIGLLGSVILAVAATLFGNGILTADQNQTITNIVAVLVPLITGLVIRFFVTPATTPGL